jgi:hypothetical protein
VPGKRFFLAQAFLRAAALLSSQVARGRDA